MNNEDIPELLNTLEAIEAARSKLHAKRDALEPVYPTAKGKALVRNDAELTAVSKVTEDDITFARDLWLECAPPEFRNILDAESEDV